MIWVLKYDLGHRDLMLSFFVGNIPEADEKMSFGSLGKDGFLKEIENLSDESSEKSYLLDILSLLVNLGYSARCLEKNQRLRKEIDHIYQFYNYLEQDYKEDYQKFIVVVEGFKVLEIGRHSSYLPYLECIIVMLNPEPCERDLVFFKRIYI